MGKMTQAELYLLDQIRQGNDRAWTQFVQRYHGRLFAYARQQLGQAADAEDIVQEVFVSFIRALNTYRAENSVESFLFILLRRRIISEYRKKRSLRVGLIQDLYQKNSDESSDYLSGFQGDEPTASTYARSDEQKEKLFLALSRTIMSLLDKIKTALNFQHLKIIELLFYCQLSNSDVAAALKIDSGRVGVLKCRWIKQIKSNLETIEAAEFSETDLEGLLSQIWQQYRPSCPKRSTIGAFLLKTLDPDWQSYVGFHINVLGCHFCKANYQDLLDQNQKKGADRLQQRIMESTVGFLQKQ
jgi:RNA polymerase sigma factor (sigma-70 family)